MVPLVSTVGITSWPKPKSGKDKFKIKTVIDTL